MLNRAVRADSGRFLLRSFAIDMKLKRALIENFKGVKQLEIDFMSTTDGLPRPITCLIGDNGSGKTTAMQAIALTLSLATRRTMSPPEFAWHGFHVERVGSLGQTRVELEVEFDKTELETTWELLRDQRSLPGQQWVRVRNVGQDAGGPSVRVWYDGNQPADEPTLLAEGRFLGRFLTNAAAKIHPEKRRQLVEIGDVFWFTQDRNIGSLQPTRRGSWLANLGRLREILVAWWAIHSSPVKTGDTDHISLLEEHFNRVFPGTKFVGVQERRNTIEPGPQDVYFLL
jgi:hypothetical protein